MSTFNQSQSHDSCFLFPVMGLQWAHGWFWAMWPQAICYEDALGKIFFPRQKTKVSLSPLPSLPPIFPHPLLTAPAKHWSPLAFRAQACELSHCPPGALVCTEEIVGLLSFHSPRSQFPLINLSLGMCVCVCVCICTHTDKCIKMGMETERDVLRILCLGESLYRCWYQDCFQRNRILRMSFLNCFCGF